MDRYLIEKCLVEHCSATLASMKSANLFNMTLQMIQTWKIRLSSGISA